MYISHFRDMACLLQPECNFLYGFFRCNLPIEVVDVEVKITSMQGTHIFRRDQTMQVIKCTPWSTRLCPHPTIIKKMKTFLEVEGKMWSELQPQPAIFRAPLPNTNPNIRKDNAAEKRKQSSAQEIQTCSSQAYQPHIQRPHLNPRMMCQTANQFQFARAPHGLVQAKCQATYLKIETGCSLPNYLSNDNANKTESEPKNTASVTSPRPPVKEEELRAK